MLSKRIAKHSPLVKPKLEEFCGSDDNIDIIFVEFRFVAPNPFVDSPLAASRIIRQWLLWSSTQMWGECLRGPQRVPNNRPEDYRIV